MNTKNQTPITRRAFLQTASVLGAAVLLPPALRGAFAAKPPHKYPVTKTDAEWKRILTPAQYHVLREQGTEMAYTGLYAETHDKGTYVCAACAQPLFSSSTKFESGTGWPSFYAPITPGAIITQTDNSLGMSRDEVVCSRCGGHLGHVFNDGPKPTGLRYCMNSVALKLIKK